MLLNREKMHLLLEVLLQEFTYNQRPYAYLGELGISIEVIGGVLANKDAVVVSDVEAGDKYRYKT